MITVGSRMNDILLYTTSTIILSASTVIEGNTLTISGSQGQITLSPANSIGTYGPANVITFNANSTSSMTLCVDSSGFNFVNSQIYAKSIGRSAAYSCSLPSKSGTIALTSDINITNVKLLDSIDLWSSGYQASLYKYAHFFLYGTSGGTMEYSIGNVSSTLSNGYTVEIIRFGNIFYKKVYYSNDLVSYNYHNLNTTGTTNLITQKVNIYGGSGFVKGITFNF